MMEYSMDCISHVSKFIIHDIIIKNTSFLQFLPYHENILEYKNKIGICKFIRPLKL